MGNTRIWGFVVIIKYGADVRSVTVHRFASIINSETNVRIVKVRRFVSIISTVADVSTATAINTDANHVTKLTVARMV